MPIEEKEYIKDIAGYGWTPDVIIGRANQSISCSKSSLYRRFKQGEFNVLQLPMKGKRKASGHQERKGKQAFISNINDIDIYFTVLGSPFQR